MKYIPEEELIQKLQSGEIGWKDYVQSHSREMKQGYEQFCTSRNLDSNDEQSAVAYMDMLEQEFDNAIANGNV